MATTSRRTTISRSRRTGSARRGPTMGTRCRGTTCRSAELGDALLLGARCLRSLGCWHGPRLEERAALGGLVVESGREIAASDALGLVLLGGRAVGADPGIVADAGD